MKEKLFLRKEKAARSIDMTMEQCTRREALGLAWALSCSLPDAQAKPGLRLPGMVRDQKKSQQGLSLKLSEKRSTDLFFLFIKVK